MTPIQKAIIDAGNEYPGVQVCLSEPHQRLMELAQDQADYMARKQKQGHQNFQSRYNIINKELGLSATEICAESWSWQKNETYLELGIEMFRCWKQSPGHWSVASKKHKYFGCGMAQGKNGVWYACIITAN